jgi:DNA-binding NtrC family response regulator
VNTTILIIDDENDLRGLLVKLLKLEEFLIYDAETYSILSVS